MKSGSGTSRLLPPLLTALMLLGALLACSDTSTDSTDDMDTGVQQDADDGELDASDDTESDVSDADDTGADAEDTGTAQPDADAATDADNGDDTDPCEGRVLPSDWTRLTTGDLSCRHSSAGDGNPFGWIDDADCRYFDQIYPWPWDEQQSSQRVIGTRANLDEGRQYIAIEIDSGSIAPDAQGQLDINIPQVHEMENSRKLFSISTCPGDFNQTEIEQQMGDGCYGSSFVDNIRFGGTDYFDEPRCALEPDETYYINFIHTEDDEGTAIEDLEPAPDCVDTNCGFRLTPYGSAY